MLTAVLAFCALFFAAASAASAVAVYVWPGTYDKSAYMSESASLCSDGFFEQWWHYNKVNLTATSSQVIINAAGATQGLDSGANSPLYWGAMYIWSPAGGQSYSNSAPYPAALHSLARPNRIVAQTWPLSYTYPVHHIVYFGSYPIGTPCNFSSWMEMFKY